MSESSDSDAATTAHGFKTFGEFANSVRLAGRGDHEHSGRLQKLIALIPVDALEAKTNDKPKGGITGTPSGLEEAKCGDFDGGFAVPAEFRSEIWNRMIGPGPVAQRRFDDRLFRHVRTSPLQHRIEFRFRHGQKKIIRPRKSARPVRLPRY